ncbi:winged helix-turn-helix transcriptional regulator [Larkinella soli]|uniref:winged helix-turn-helix transcriptional regulator n=1 Tax=Larkinella soli TaxID=1770527 RepID=UPI0019D2398B|nr:helix-turn-helix domain-containing protein [Larkinella soli]
MQAEPAIYSSDCPIDFCIDLLKGKCKAAMLISVADGCNRYGQLRRRHALSQRMLARQLDELEESGLLTRTVFAEVPPRVEYALTDSARSLLPILRQLLDWGRTTALRLPDQAGR